MRGSGAPILLCPAAPAPAGLIGWSPKHPMATRGGCPLILGSRAACPGLVRSLGTRRWISIVNANEDDLALALIERLDMDTKLSLDSKVLVYAAFEGAAALDAAIEGGGALPSANDFAAAADAPEPVGAYLTKVTVSGFRGVGPERSLDLKPAPGLTVICGRNGSGKSTFAEAIEIALTGHNERWADDRAVEWRDGWRNLHVAHPTQVELQLLVEGQTPAQTVVRRRWPQAGDLKSAIAEVQPTGQPVQPLTSLGWQQPLETYRPFLTYNEL